jgi:hypothetical protein
MNWFMLFPLSQKALLPSQSYQHYQPMPNPRGSEAMKTRRIDQRPVEGQTRRDLLKYILP